MALDQVLYTAHATATGGRDGRAVTSDNKLDVALARPKELGGNGQGTNPEQLFAAGYAACFIGAMGFVAGQSKKLLPAAPRSRAPRYGPTKGPRSSTPAQSQPKTRRARTLTASGSSG